MLTVPAHAHYDGLTVYSDDTEFWRFYPVSDAPRIRRSADGDPVLLLLTYATSDAERAAHPELPPGGGYLSFDTVLDPTDAELAAARTALQAEVDAEWQRLRSGTAEDQARPGVAGTDRPPAIVFGIPTFTTGSVTLDAPQSAQLVTARVSAGTPTLLADNLASFDLDLTPDGATFLARTLVAGADDPTPLQVRYALSFWARLPPARIHMAVAGEKMHDYIHKQLAGRGIDECTTYDYDHSDVTEESLTMSGAVTVQIDTGSGSLPDDVISQLRAYAFDTLKTLIQSSFFADKPATAGQPVGAGAPAVRLLPFRDRSMQLKDLDTGSMNVTLDLEQSSVVAWSIAPAATLTGVVGADEAARARHIRRISLDDPFFTDIATEVSVYTDFGALEHVEVELSHSGSDGTGAPRHTGTVLVFRDNAPQRWSVPRYTDAGTYQARHRVVYRNSVAGPWSDWETSDSPRLPISIPAPGVLQASVVVGNIDFTGLVVSVQVTFDYGDADHGVPDEQRSVVLTAAAPSGTYRREIGVPKQQPLRYRTRFDLHSGDVIDDGQWQEVLGDQVVINQPTESVLRVSLLPTGNGWGAVNAVFVTLEHTDTDGHVTGDTLVLRSAAEFLTWQVYLRDRTARTYRYRWTASFKDGATQTREWTASAGDPVLNVDLARSGVEVVVVADALRFDTSPLTEVTLHSANPAATTTLVFRNATPQTWYLDGADPATLDLTVSVTHFPPGRDPVVLPDRHETDAVVVLPAYQRDAGGLLQIVIIGTQVDYTQTPLVGVDIAFGPGEDVTAALTLTKDAPVITWQPPAGSAPVASFRTRITYFDSAGTPTAGSWVTSTVARVVVPRLAVPVVP